MGVYVAGDSLLLEPLLDLDDDDEESLVPSYLNEIDPLRRREEFRRILEDVYECDDDYDDYDDDDEDVQDYDDEDILPAYDGNVYDNDPYPYDESIPGLERRIWNGRVLLLRI